MSLFEIVFIGSGVLSFFYNGHLRGPVTHTPIAERLEVELSLPDLTISRLGFEHLIFRLPGERSNSLCHRRGLS